MKYKIEGADAKTGKSRVLRIEADDEKQAATRAHDMGLLVSAIHARPDSTSDRPDMTSDKEFALNDAAPAAARSHSGSSYVAMPIPPSTPSASAEARKAVLVSPEYGGLRAASIVLHVLAMVAYVGGLIALVMTLYSLTHWGWETSKYVLATAGLTIVSGAILHGMSASCDAIRDIAQNSFRK
jgi:hypothetical protein